jgi:hypothetical protein
MADICEFPINAVNVNRLKLLRSLNQKVGSGITSCRLGLRGRKDCRRTGEA